MEAKQDTQYFCDVSSLNSEERNRYQEFEKLLPEKIKEMTEINGGYALSFPMSAENFMLLAEFVTFEGRCCPFLSFSLSANFGDEMGTLAITGVEDAQDFIKAELGLL